MTYWNDITFSTTIVPPGYLRIPEVFEIIGQHFFSGVSTWTGDEGRFDERIAYLPPIEAVYGADGDDVVNSKLYESGEGIVRRVLALQTDSANKLTRLQWKHADGLRQKWQDHEEGLIDRQMHVFWIMYRLGMSGNLGYCHINSKGEIREVDKTAWNVTWDVACDRFEHGALNINPTYSMSRPSPWNEGRGYVEFFAVPLLVARDQLLARIRKLPLYEPEGPSGDEAASTRIVDRFFENLAAGDQEDALRQGLDGPRVSELSHFDPVIKAWALDAASRDVVVREAGDDARQRLTNIDVTNAEAQAALKAAMTLAGKTVRRGRRPGSKSFVRQR